MNKAALKKYAPQARLDFIAAVTRRAELLGLNPKKPATVERQGDALLINGKPFPARFAQMRSSLESWIREQGFPQVMESMAYTWFNRFVAIRYMELHDYLDHGYRVLSHPDNRESGHTQPQILENIAELDLPGFNKAAALELKLAGNKDEDLYREVLLAQCHALHTAMPFLFESLDDATELLLPDGLLRTDSILAALVTKIDESDWQEVEIIGWLYQFYISEKKDQVIGKVVKSEDIPAATQLFTPNWIVKYLVQNSLGRLWLMANPNSTLASKWDYYIKPAEQTPEVNARLDALIQARISEDGSTLNPESLTLLDPACGSGHILVEAYDLLRDIYLERGYRRQDIPRLILEKNLFGLDIDDRAAQLAGFALLMKARTDDRRLFGQPPALNVMALQETASVSLAELYDSLDVTQTQFTSIAHLVENFREAKSFGSLIQIPCECTNELTGLKAYISRVIELGDLLARDAAEIVSMLLRQTEFLSRTYDSVVVNPPYLGSRAMPFHLKSFVNNRFPNAKTDVFASFITRATELGRESSQIACITPYVWMFLSSYEQLRRGLVELSSLTSLVRLEYNAFEPACVPVCAFTFNKTHVSEFRGKFIDLSGFRGHENQAPRTLQAIKDPSSDWIHVSTPDNFSQVPGYVIAFWLPEKAIDVFKNFPSINESFDLKQGLATGENEKFLRYWFECDFQKISFDSRSADSAKISGKKWFPCQKGGGSRKWYGNNLFVINWENDGSELKSHQGSVIRNPHYYFREGATWGSLTISALTMRFSPVGHIFESKGAMAFPRDNEDIFQLIGYANSKVMDYFLKVLSPTLDYSQGPVGSVPYPVNFNGEVSSRVKEAVAISQRDWDFSELSYGFLGLEFVNKERQNGYLIEKSYDDFFQKSSVCFNTLLEIENELGIEFAREMGVQGLIDSRVDAKEIDLHLFDRENLTNYLLSYAMGCIMGRYSLDTPGLIYAHAGNEAFDPSSYETFPADDDGIVPITDGAWFDDDGANRIHEFIRVVWGEETLGENMAWLAKSIGSKTSESADDTIRRYLSRDFYKDHLQTYKKRPIYWLFSSGKHKAFEALVYLHRYNAGTLSRMRMEYVVPLQSRMQARIDSLIADIASSSSSAEQKRLQKQKDKLAKQLVELRDFDENLRHYADQRIELDLDDGVKANYGKFGNLLAEVKTVTGG